jgi:hypothetical protein
MFVLFDKKSPNAVCASSLVLFEIGNSIVLTGVNVGTQAIARPEHCAIAAYIYGFMRSLGMPLGVAVSLKCTRITL